MTEAYPHVTVMRDEAVAALAPADGEIFVDCTLGMGGHTEAILEAADCRVIGLDRDDQALAIASERLARFGDRFTPVKAAFGDLDAVLEELGLDHVHGVLADLGVSSLQLDTAERGFSFRAAGPLDMRMDPTSGITAAEYVNTAGQDEIAETLKVYGEERFSGRVARIIVEGRPWRDTASLASAIAGVIPGARKSRIHPATRSFQALRIKVNDELGQLERLLPTATDRLHPGGRLVIISFHSLEDRLVKRYLAQQSGRNTPRDPYGNPVVPPRLRAPSRALSPSPSDPNPRSRSARLRSAVRLT